METKRIAAWATIGLLASLVAGPALAGQAGHALPGTTEYPDGGMRRLDHLFGRQERDPRCAAIDPEHRYAYLGTETTPGQVIKIDMAECRRVDSLTIPEGGGCAYAAIIDPAGDYAYFAGGGSRVERIDLRTFSYAGALVTSGSALIGAAIDPAGDFAYFTTYSSPARVIKVDLASFTEAGILPLESDEWLGVTAVIDPAGEYAYIGTWGEPYQIVKVDLATFTRVDDLDVPGEVICGLMDPTGSFGYFGTYGYPGAVVRVNLAGFTRAGTLPLLGGGYCVESAVMDPAGACAYFGKPTYPGQVLRLDLASFAWTGDLVLAEGQNELRCAVFDAERGSACFATYNDGSHDEDPSWVVWIDSDALEPLAAIALPDDRAFAGALIERSGVHAYFSSGTSWDEARILKLRLSDRQLVNEVTLDGSQRGAYCGVIDPSDQYAYWGTWTGQIVKMALPNLAPVDMISIGGTYYFEVAAIDPDGIFAYFAVAGQARVVRIDLTDFSLAGEQPLAGSANPTVALIGPSGDYAYICASSYAIPGRVHRYELAGFSPAGILELTPEHGRPSSGFMDPAGEYACFATETSPARIVKVDLAGFAPTAWLELGPGEDEAASAVVDPNGRFALIGTSTYSPRIVKIDLESFSPVGTLILGEGEQALDNVVISPDGARAYIARSVEPGRVTVIAPSQAGLLKATRFALAEPAAVRDVRFYSHAAEGQVRLALYDDNEPRGLVWQSEAIANDIAGGELVVPIAAGAPPELLLGPGDYWAAWQVDTTANVPSYAPGDHGQGFLLAAAFGPAPETIRAEESLFTSEIWTEYIVYQTAGVTPTPTAAITPTPTPTATVEPTSSPTPPGTPTAAPTYALGVRLELPLVVHPGEEFSVTGWLDNPGPALADVPVFFILDVYGEYWFWDDWTHFDPATGAGIDYVEMNVPSGSTELAVIPAFPWPDTGPDSAHGLRFWGAMLNETRDDFLGEIAIAVWGYGP